MGKITPLAFKEIVVTVKNLTKSFHKKQVLNIPSITIREGEVVALIGPSGSGKSTLLRHLNGLITADQGMQSKVEVCGKTIQSNGRLGRRIRHYRHNIGFVFQQFNLLKRMTALDNVLVGALQSTPFWRTYLKRFSKGQRIQAMEALQSVGMDAYAYQRVSTLSGGQQQRVAIARSLMQGAKVVLADEPIAALDPKAAKTVMGMLRDICQQKGITMVITLHQVDYAMEYCQRIIALQNGLIFYDGLAEDMSKTELAKLYQMEHEEDSKQSTSSSPSVQVAQSFGT